MYKFIKSNIISCIFFTPIFLLPFLQSKDLLDSSLHIRFLGLNLFLLIFATIAIFRFKFIQFGLFAKIYSIYLLYLLFNIFFFGFTSDAIFQFFMSFCFGSIVFIYQLFFKNNKIEIKTFTNIFSILTFFIVLYSFYNYFQILTHIGISHQSIYEIKASFSHKNILSEVLFLLFPFSLYGLFCSTSKLFKIIGIINSIGIIFLIIVLITRAVWLSFFLGLIITTVSFLIISKKEIKINLLKKKITYYYIVSGFFLVFTSLFIYSQLDNFETIKKSTLKIFSTYDSSMHRIELWKRSYQVFKESPIIGKGLSNWRIEVLKYGNKNLQSQDNITFYQRPHNDYLWILAEQGIIGMLLYLTLIFLIFYYLIKLINKSILTHDIIFYWLMFYLLIGYLIFSFFSFPKERVEHNLFIGIIFGFIIYKYNELIIIPTKKTSKLLLNKLGILVLIIILTFSNIFAYKRYISEMHLKKAFEARSKSDWNLVIKEIEKAESYAYQIDPFSTPLKWYSGEAYYNLSEYDKAFSNFSDSYKLNPFHIHVLNNLATCYELKGNHNLAIDFYKRSLKIAPQFEDALLNITAIYYNLNFNDSAYVYISMIDTNSLNPKYKTFLNTVLSKRIDTILQNNDNKLITEVIENIKANKEWIFNIFVKSKTNCIIFDKQLLKDCLYVLYNNQSKIDSVEYRKFQIKYIDN
jgi:O-antigen ligase